MRKHIFILFWAVVLVNCGWLQAGFSTNPMDFNNDKKVNILDFAEFASNWLWNATPDPNEFAFIPAGTFEMGDHTGGEGEPDELPTHTVTLDSFYMSKYELTHQQYCEYLNSAYPAQIKVDGGVVYAADDASNSFPYCNTSTFVPWSQINYSAGVFSINVKDGTTDMSNHPMGMVSWYGCVAYCNWKSQQDNLESCYDLSTWECDFSKDGYRLPTEAEWEYAARGGEHSPYYRLPWGNSFDDSMANWWLSLDPYETITLDNPWTTPVGYYDGGQTPTGIDMANGYGLYDMVGNVSEWCNDMYDSGYYQYCVDNTIVNNPTGPASSIFRVLRDGSWLTRDFRCRNAHRDYIQPVDRRDEFGFRVCVFASHQI